MDLLAMAMVLKTVLFASEPATHDHSSSPTAQQRKVACSRTFWCCDHAPRGWQLSQLFLPWIILLVLCMPCLSATGESTSTMEAGCLESSFGGGVKVPHEVASIVCATIDCSDSVEVAASKEGLGVGDVHLSRSSEAERFDLLAQKELFPALCMLPGWSHVWQAFLSANLQTDSPVKIVVQACAVQEQSVAAILDWCSNRNTSVAFKFLTLTNRQCDAEVKVCRILASNAQLFTVDSQEVVLSPSCKVSIVLAYIPNFIGKAEGHMLLQTNTGGVKVKILGDGVSSLIKIHPFLTKAVWQETISLVNPFAEPVSIREAYVWVEPMSNQSRGEGVLCRKFDFMPVCSYHGRLKIGPIAEWTVAPHSTTPIMDLSFVVEDEDALVGTLCLKIYRHSVHLSEILVFPMKMQWHAGAISSSKLSGKGSLLEVEEVNAGNGRAMFVRKSIRWRVQVSEVSVRNQRTNMLITTPKETLKLGFGFSKELGDRGWIGYSRKTLFTYITEAIVSTKLIIDHNSALYPAVWVPCSANISENVVGKDACLAKRSQCFNFCRVSAMVKGFANACWPVFICAHKSDRRDCVKGILAVMTKAAQCLNGSITRVSNELAKMRTCSALFSQVDLAEVKNKGHELNLLALSLEPGCGWPSPGAACKLSGLSVSESRIHDGSKLNKGAFKQEHRERDIDTSFVMQDSSSFKSQALMPGSLKQKELVNIGICASKYAGPLDSLEFDSVDRAVEGEAHSLPLKDSTTDHSPAICHASLTFSRYQKVFLKVSLLILFALSIVLVKLLKQEKFLMTDVRLRDSCSHTFFLHPVCLKSTYISKRFDAMNIVECPDDSYYENKLLNVFARVARSLGFVLRWVFDSQATVVNVRVQIAERPCVASVDHALSKPRKSCLADDGSCSMERRCVEKPSSYPTSTPVQVVECRGCADGTDSSRKELFEVSTSSLVCLLTTHGLPEDGSQRPSSSNRIEDLNQTLQLTEKKERGKRRKKRNNIIDLKQEPERMGQSASSSPPSSPASPATPLGGGSVSPFIWSDSPSRSLRGVSNSGRLRGNAFGDSTSRRSPREPVDVRGEQAHCSSTKKGASQQKQNFGSKTTLELRGRALVQTDSTGKGSVRIDSLKDTCTGENWAAVARRTVAIRNEPDQRQGLAGSSRCLTKGDVQVRPVLLPSATFPQRGRSMQWSPRMLEKRNLSDPMMSPSLVSTSPVGPLARAPGSKPSMACNESPSGNNSGGATAQVGGIGICANERMDQGIANDEYLYDIWGNHFAVFSYTTMPTNTSSRVPSYADAAASPSTPSAGFSIFSRDTFF